MNPKRSRPVPYAADAKDKETKFLGHDQLVTKLLTGGLLTGTKTNWIFTN